MVIATKAFWPTGEGSNDHGAGRKHVLGAVEASLRRLRTDYIDLYQLHVDDEATPLEETLAALDDLVRAGKVLYTGVSNLRAYRVMKALAMSDRLGAARFVSFQGQYNLIVRTLEREHFRLFAEEGLGFIAWSPLAAGMLTGKVQAGTAGAAAPGTRLSQRKVAFDAFFKNERGFAIADVVRALASEAGCIPAQLALAWQRTRPVTSVIVGARTMQQLEDNLGALDVAVPAEVVEQLEAATKPEDEYPGGFIDIFQGWLRGGVRSVQ
jgi:aryl-alcohol dehydrogenase-like predicted oxidoreductase